MDLKQYAVVLVDLDPTRGSEMKTTRSCVVLSPDEMNRHLQTLVIAPVTSTSRPYPTRVQIKGEHFEGWLVLDQIRTIDRFRVIRAMGQLSAEEIRRTKAILKETFVD